MREMARRCRNKGQFMKIITDLKKRGVRIIDADQFSLIIVYDDTPSARELVNNLPRISCI